MGNIEISNNQRTTSSHIDSPKRNKKEYLLHLWEINRPYYSAQETLNLIAPRAKYRNSEAKIIIKDENMFW
ncbi:hypothetical protein QYZ87_10905 [Porphyromonadaceae bacterium W3.11]|nr:hypothetical protein [Porphyromonadaceae bacterium W3.11]MDN4755015.1 hypothetical protein [Porphyromonadaceae bacterium W3.11]